jgi:inositol phosphorylceramide mannosyltransferase catalytic subunit
MIPKIFHRIWLGGKPMPVYFSHWGESWQKKHPAWKMKLWTEREIYGFTNADLLPRCNSISMQSDIARYEILYREGGVYLDPDMECRKSIDMLIGSVDFFACWQNKDLVSNAIFGSTKGHKLLQKIVWDCRKEFRTDHWSSMGSPYFTPKVLAHPGAKVFDRETFIPFTREEYARFPKKPMVQVDAPPTAYAVYHRAPLWYKDSTATLAGVKK